MTSKNKSPHYLTDHFLIAMPTLEDVNFTHSVTYICEHSAEGAMGVTINRPSDIVLKEVLDQSNIDIVRPAIGEEIIFHGGPVHPDRGFILHDKSEHNWESSLDITDNLQLTSSKDILEAIAIDEGPKEHLITLGYAGWGSGQLEHEIADNIWLSCPATEDIIFHTAVEKRWESAASLLGIDLQLLSNDAGHA